MRRPQRVLVVSHCVLNQYAVLNDWERAAGAFPFVDWLRQQGVGFLQLPCPELLACGEGRLPMSYADYAAMPGFRAQCRQWLAPTIAQLRAYRGSATTYIGVIGIHESPNCSISGQRGVLMEEYMKACAANGLCTDYLEVPTWYSATHEGTFLREVQTFLAKEV